MGKYFITDSFRTEASINLTADYAYLGWYYSALRDRNGKNELARIVIGTDTRHNYIVCNLTRCPHAQHICPQINHLRVQGLGRKSVSTGLLCSRRFRFSILLFLTLAIPTL